MLDLDDKLRVLIKNYNSEENKYELGRGEIKSFSKSEFKNFLKSLPRSNPNLNFPIEIYTKKLRIVKYDEEKCIISETRLPIPFDYHERKRERKFETIDETVFRFFGKVDNEEIYEEDPELVWKKFSEEREEKKNKKRRIIALILDYTLNLFVVFMLLYAPLRFFSMMNLLSLTFWIWVLCLTPLNLYSILHKNKKRKEKVTRIKLGIPILDHYTTADFSRWTINTILTYSTLLLVIPLLILNLPSVEAIVLLILCIILCAFYILILYVFYGVYGQSKYKKVEIVDNILNYIQQEDLTWSEKQYYLYICVEFKKKKVASIGYYSKIYAILTLLFSIIPQIFSNI